MQQDKIIALTSAASVELEPIWASLLTKALEGKNVKDLLSNVGAGGGAPAAGGAAPAGGAPAAAAEEKKEEKKEEEKEESDDDMVSTLCRKITCPNSTFTGLRSVRLILSFIPCCMVTCAAYHTVLYSCISNNAHIKTTEKFHKLHLNLVRRLS